MLMIVEYGMDDDWSYSSWSYSFSWNEHQALKTAENINSLCLNPKALEIINFTIINEHTLDLVEGSIISMENWELVEDTETPVCILANSSTVLLAKFNYCWLNPGVDIVHSMLGSFVVVEEVLWLVKSSSS